MFSRRKFLASSAASFAGATSVLGALGQQNAFAANVTGYKAIICVMLEGGMDHADTIIPTDAPSYDLLAAQRQSLFGAYRVGDGTGTSSRERTNLLELNPDNGGQFGTRRFGLPSDLREMHAMFESGDMAIIGNVGPLIEPIDSDGFEQEIIPIPRSLFSHNDQRSTWMSFGPEGTTQGWGGRFADAVISSAPSDNALFTAVTAGVSDVFLSGESARAFRATLPRSGSALNIIDGARLPASRATRQDVAQQLSELIRDTTLNPDNIYARDMMRINARGLGNMEQFITAVSSSPTNPVSFPSTSIGKQLEAITTTIAARDALNVSRQVFYVSMNGWDTHADQALEMPDQHNSLSQALDAFRRAMIAEGIWDDVVLFTASDFGRTLNDNGNGTDHGWGGHHFAMGGNVRGRRIYGDIPAADPDLQVYTRRRARLIPTSPVEHYAETLGLWFGLSPAELSNALPNLGAFPSNNLDFIA